MGLNRIFFASALSLAILAGCGGGGDGTAPAAGGGGTGGGGTTTTGQLTNSPIDGVPYTATPSGLTGTTMNRSEERRVGKECRSRWSPYH